MFTGGRTMKRRINLWIAMALSVVLLSVSGLIFSMNLKDEDEAGQPVHAAFQYLDPGGNTANRGTSETNPHIIPDVATLNGSTNTQFRGHIFMNRFSTTPVYYRLGADMNLGSIANWTPIPQFGPNLVLDGKFTCNGLNGCGRGTGTIGAGDCEHEAGTVLSRRITNLSNTATGSGQGFFANFQGTIKNIEFVNPQFTGNGNLRGVVAATVDRTAVTAADSTINARIENVSVTGGVVNGTRAGGLVGAVGLTTASTNGTQTVVTASLGDVAPGSVNLSIVDSSSGATIQGTSTAERHGNGGLVGYIFRSHVDIMNSFNTGNVRMVTNNGNVNGVGGLVGLVSGAAGANNPISMELPATAANAVLNITASHNSGVVGFGTTFNPASAGVGSTINTSSFSHGVGGLVGYIQSANTANLATTRVAVDIKAAYNEGHVFLVSGGSNANDASIQRGVGGLIGASVRGNIDIVHGKNLGQVSATTPSQNNVVINLGGLIGWLSQSDTTITSSLNTGNISASGSNGGGTQGGGLVGGNTTAQNTVSVEGSANTGNFSGNVGTNANTPGLVNGGTPTYPGEPSFSSTGTGPNVNPGAAEDLADDLIEEIEDEILAVQDKLFWVSLGALNAGSFEFSAPQHSYREGFGFRFVEGEHVNFSFTITLLDINQGAPSVRIAGGVGGTLGRPGDEPADSDPRMDFKYIITDITEDLVIEVFAIAKVQRTVVLPENGDGFTIVDHGTRTVDHGEDITFTLQITEHFMQTRPVVIGPGTVKSMTPEGVAGDGVYTVVFTVTNNTEGESGTPFVITSVKNTYTVTLDTAEEGFTFQRIRPASDSVLYEGQYVFTVTNLPNWVVSQVRVNNVPVSPQASGDDIGRYVITVMGPTSIEVTAALEQRTVTLNGFANTIAGGAAFEFVGGALTQPVPHGSTFSFRIKVAPSHNRTPPTASRGGVNIPLQLATGTGDEYTGSFQVTGDTTVTISPVINEYTITYLPGAHGGDESFTQTREHGDDEEEFFGLGTFTRDGHTLTGWECTCCETSYALGAVITVDEDLTLLPVWTIHRSTLEFDLDGGSYPGGVPSLANQEWDTTYTLQIPTQTHYTFTGWDVDVQGNSFNDSTRVFTFLADGGTATATATWAKTEYTLSYNRGTHGDGTPIANSDKTYTDDPWAISDNTGPVMFTRVGHTLVGWTTANGGVTCVCITVCSTAAHPCITHAFGQTLNVTGNFELFPVWRIIRYNVEVEWLSVGHPTSPSHFGELFVTSGEAGFDTPGFWLSEMYNHGSDVVLNILPTVLLGAVSRIEIFRGEAPAQIIPLSSSSNITGYVVSNITAATRIVVIFEESEITRPVTLTPGAGYTLAAVGASEVQNNRMFTFRVTFTGGYSRFVLDNNNVMAVFGGFAGWPAWVVTEPVSTVVVTHISGSTFEVRLPAILVAPEDVANPLPIAVAAGQLKLNEYTITYRAGTGAVGADITYTREHGDDWWVIKDTTPVTFTKAGWRQTGWNTQTDGSGTAFAFNYADYEVEGDLTLFAIWTQNTSSLTLALDGGAITGGTSFNNQLSGSVLSLATPTKEGHTFTGWAVPTPVNTNDGTLAGSVGAGFTFTFGNTHNGTSTLTATWSINTSTLVLALNGGEYPEEMPNLTNRNFNTTYTVLAPTRDGHVFTGWVRSGSTNGTFEGGVFTFGPTLGTTTTLTAQWAIKRFTIEIDLNDTPQRPATYTGADEVTQNWNTPHTLLTPTRTGYRFDGWVVVGTSHGTLNGLVFTFNVDSPNNSVTQIQATWTELTYDITFAQGNAPLPTFGGVTGSRAPGEKSFFTPFTLPNEAVFFATGWRQIGWTTVEGGAIGAGQITHQFGGSYTVNDAVTFYPVWEHEARTITATPGAGFTITGAPATVLHGADGGSFTVTMLAGQFRNTMPVVRLTPAGGDAVVLLPTSGNTTTGVFTFALGTVTVNTTITVHLLYTVSVTQNITDPDNTVTTSIVPIGNNQFHVHVTIATATNYRIQTFRINGFNHVYASAPFVFGQHPDHGVVTFDPPVHQIVVVFERPTWTLTFDSNFPAFGGTSGAPAWSISGLQGNAPDNDTADWDLRLTGWRLTGWSTSPTSSVGFVAIGAGTFPALTGNVTYYAVWHHISYGIGTAPAVDINDLNVNLSNTYNPATTTFLLGQTGTRTIVVNAAAGSGVLWQVAPGANATSGFVYIDPTGATLTITEALMRSLIAANPGIEAFTFRAVLMQASAITPTITGSGTVTVATDTSTSTLTSGTQTQVRSTIPATITITPAAHFRIASATINGVNIMTGSSDTIGGMPFNFTGGVGGRIVTVSALAHDITLVVTFEAIQYNVTIQAVNANTGANIGAGTIPNITRTLTVDEPVIVWDVNRAGTYIFGDFAIVPNFGDLTPQRSLPGVFGQFHDGFMWLYMTETFPIRFLHSTNIIIHARYNEQHTVELVFADEPGVEVFVAYNDGMEWVYFDNPRGVLNQAGDTIIAGNAAAANTAMRIEVHSSGHHTIVVAPRNNGDNSIVLIDEGNGIFIFDLSRTVVFDLSFALTSVALVRETFDRDGQPIVSEVPVGDFTIGGGAQSVNLAPAPSIGDPAQYFITWRIFENPSVQHPAGRMIDVTASTEGITMEGNTVTHITFSNAFVNRHRNRDNEIVLYAIYSSSIWLQVQVSDNSQVFIPDNSLVQWHNQFALKVGNVWVGGTWADEPGASAWNRNPEFDFEALAIGGGWVDSDEFFGLAIQVPYNTRIEIIPIPSRFYTFESVTGATLADLGGHNLHSDGSITLNFESKEFSMIVNNRSPGVSGALVFEEELRFKIGDTISIAFEPGTGRVLDEMRIGMKAGDKEAGELDITGMAFRNGMLTIDVSVLWLIMAEEQEWINMTNPAAPVFTIDIEVDEAINPLVIAGVSAGGAVLLIVLIGIIIAMVSMQKKKADYKAAREKHKAGMARLNQNIVSDLLKDEG